MAFIHCLLVTMAVVTLPSTTAAARSPYRVGNSIIDGSAPTQSDTTFLMDDQINTQGALFAFSGYFLNTNPIYFQIWRPVNVTDRLYQLVAEWVYTPIKAGRREDLYIGIQSPVGCLVVEPADRMAAYIPEAPGSLAYDFSGANPRTYQHTVLNGSRTTPGSTAQFDQLPWPYKFSMAAYIDPDTTLYPASGSARCPTDLVIPNEGGYGPGGVQAGGTGATGPQGSLGATGPQGASGPKGSLGAQGVAGPTGQQGAQGAEGRQGATGPIGPGGTDGAAGAPGPQGVTGEAGQKGDKGDAGESGRVEAAPIVSSFDELVGSCEWCRRFLNPYLILGLIVWLVLVTLLLLITMGIVTCRKQPSNNYNRNVHTGAKDDLWKKYENGGYDANGDTNGENTYNAIEEGRTEF